MRLEVLGCPVSAALLERWQELFVCESAPWFLPAGLHLPDEVPVVARSALQQGIDFSYQDSYATWRVSPEVQQVTLLNPAQFDALSDPHRLALLQAQVELQRGQVYRWSHVEQWVSGCQELARSRSIQIGDERFLVLDAAVWWVLDSVVQAEWLMDFINWDSAPSCQSSRLTEAEWVGLPPIIRQLAGTFAMSSGPNCFATVLAAITTPIEAAEAVAARWVQQDEFLAGLARVGYIRQPEQMMTLADLRDVVLVWKDTDGTPQHAAYLIGDRLVFNKNAQGWYMPRQLLRLDELLDHWKEDAFALVVYSQS